MDQMTKHTEIRNTKQDNHTARRITGTIFGTIEIILAFRLIFKLLGANPTNIFVKVIYAVTQLLVGIFEGIFSRATTSGAETTAIFEPATLIAMVVIAVIAWVVLKAIKPHTGDSSEKTEYTQQNNQTTSTDHDDLIK